eukprot:6198359-Pleurochrysis_carterae.AAC.1
MVTTIIIINVLKLTSKDEGSTLATTKMMMVKGRMQRVSVRRDEYVQPPAATTSRRARRKPRRRLWIGKKGCYTSASACHATSRQYNV